MNLDKLFIKFDDGEHYPKSFKYSAILGLSESYYHPNKMDENGNFMRTSDGNLWPDTSQRNPVLTVICTNSTEFTIKDITIDEFMSTIENYYRVEAEYKFFNQVIIKRHATYNKQLAVKVVNVVDVCT
jgi:hypothetical protein